MITLLRYLALVRARKDFMTVKHQKISLVSHVMVLAQLVLDPKVGTVLLDLLTGIYIPSLVHAMLLAQTTTTMSMRIIHVLNCTITANMAVDQQ